MQEDVGKHTIAFYETQVNCLQLEQKEIVNNTLGIECDLVFNWIENAAACMGSRSYREKPSMIWYQVCIRRRVRMRYRRPMPLLLATAKDMELKTSADELVANLVKASVEIRNLKDKSLRSKKRFYLFKWVNDKAHQARDPVGQKGAPKSKGRSKRNRNRGGERGTSVESSWHPRFAAVLRSPQTVLTRCASWVVSSVCSCPPLRPCASSALRRMRLSPTGNAAGLGGTVDHHRHGSRLAHRLRRCKQSDG